MKKVVLSVVFSIVFSISAFAEGVETEQLEDNTEFFMNMNFYVGIALVSLLVICAVIYVVLKIKDHKKKKE